jgi:hypothetical protein
MLFIKKWGLRKINSHKMMFCFGKAKEEEQQYTQIILLPSRFSSFSISWIICPWQETLKCWVESNRDPVPWEARLVGEELSLLRRLTCFDKLRSDKYADFNVIFFEIPKGVINRLDYFRSSFFFRETLILKRNMN